MSKASDDLTMRAARAAQPRTATAVTDPPVVPLPRVEPVRLTMDLAPVAHQNLVDWCRASAVTLRVPRVPAASVFRALLMQLEADPELARRILPDVQRDVEENRRRK